MRLLIPIPYIALFIGTGCSPTDTDPGIQYGTYEHIRAAWSPDGQSIAFTATIGDTLGIYAVDSSGANMRLIHVGDAIGVSWSPTGQEIAYSQLNLIYRVSITQDIPQLIVPSAPSIRPSWSPDGQHIAYVRNSNGIRMVQVSTGIDTEVYVDGTSPSWTSDGSHILINDWRDDFSTGGYIYTVFLLQKDSLSRTEVYDVRTHDDCSFFSINPDRTFLVYARKSTNEYSQVRRVNLLTGSEFALTVDGGDYPAISHDGEWIVYTRPTQGDGGLWKMRNDGSEKRRITEP
jgi:Tol biopolymer transport system component